MDKRVTITIATNTFFLGLHFYFTSSHIQVKRKSFKKIILPFVVLFIGYKQFSFYFQKDTFLVSALRIKFKLNSLEMVL